jgi:hypothetical protein
VFTVESVQCEGAGWGLWSGKPPIVYDPSCGFIEKRILDSSKEAQLKDTRGLGAFCLPGGPAGKEKEATAPPESSGSQSSGNGSRGDPGVLLGLCGGQVYRVGMECVCSPV